jgi:hypothetical protein
MRAWRAVLILHIVVAVQQPVWAAFTAAGVSRKHESAVLHPPVLPPGGQYTPLSEVLRVQGQQVSAWVFEVPGITVAALAAWLTRQQPALSDIWVMPGSAVLAGIEGGRHWAARLFDAGSGRSRGTVSVMSLTEKSPNTASPAHVWQLSGGHLHFELQFREDNGMVTEQVWTHTLRPASLWQALRRDLMAAQWQEKRGHDALEVSGVHVWTRAQTHLSIFIVAWERGSGITTILRRQKDRAAP